MISISLRTRESPIHQAAHAVISLKFSQIHIPTYIYVYAFVYMCIRTSEHMYINHSVRWQSIGISMHVVTYPDWPKKLCIKSCWSRHDSIPIYTEDSREVMYTGRSSMWQEVLYVVWEEVLSAMPVYLVQHLMSCDRKPDAVITLRNTWTHQNRTLLAFTMSGAIHVKLKDAAITTLVCVTAFYWNDIKRYTW